MKRLIISFISIFLIVFASQAATFTVTSNADNGAGTLRQALADVANVNTGVGGHTIVFSTAMTITLNNNLDIYNDTDFNGLTINGFVDAVAGPDVIIRSNNLCGTRGFNISFALLNAKFYGLVFQNLEYGIYYNANNSATVLNSEIKGCYFGTDLTGATIQNGICKSGIYLGGASSVTIGGLNNNLSDGLGLNTNNLEKCVFGGTCQSTGVNDNNKYGAIQVSNGSNNTSIIGNHIGVNLAGTTKLRIGNPTNKLPVTQNGILIDGGTSNGTLINSNIISGANGAGIHVFVSATSITITGNKIGTDITGNLGFNATTPANSFGNEACGIYLRTVSNAVIGGNTAALRNIISANGGAAHTWPNDFCFGGWNDYNQFGIYLEYTNNTQLLGNYIGTNNSGLSSGTLTTNYLGNRAGGIKIIGTPNNSFSAINNTIGGINPGEGNVISGNGFLWGTYAGATAPGCGTVSPSGITSGHGIVLQFASCTGTNILGNYIGLGSDGITAIGNLTSGVEIEGARNNTVGGSTVSARNYICDNQFGVTIQEDFQPGSYAVATGNVVSGNYIGLNTASNAVGNGQRAGLTEGAGIILQKGSNNNTIGSAVAGGGNVISGNKSGIIFRNADESGHNTGTARGNFVYNNIIGLNPAMTASIPNTSSSGYGNGIQIEVGVGSFTTAIPYGNIIGGTLTNQPNIIAGNQKYGVYISNATSLINVNAGNQIIGNYIGTNPSSSTTVGNGISGILIDKVTATIATNATIIKSNTIGKNVSNGIELNGSSFNTIQNNSIGIDVSKTAPIPNGSNGISLTAGSASNIIGGVSANEPNFIFNNGANGVVVDGAASINNSIHKNSFSCNTLRGIVLSNNGNGLYAKPTIAGTPTQITWTGPASSFIEVYETDGCANCSTGSSDRLQGKTLVASGASPFVFTTALGFDKTKQYTALAHAGSTTAAHNTSEFTGCYILCQDPTSVAISAGGPTTFCAGGSVTLTAVITGGIGTVTYQWKNASGNIAGATNSTYVATVAGSYTVVYNSDQACTANITSAATTVTVNPNPTISSTNTQVVCSGTALNYSITSAVASSYSWTRTAVAGISNATVTSSANPITETLINTTTSPVNTVYSITPTSTTGSCTGAAFTLTVTVNPKPVVSSPNTDVVCSGSPLSYNITSAVASSYSWTRTAVSGISNATVTSSANPITETLNNTTTAPVNTVYSIIPTSTTGSCPGNPYTLTVTVNPKPSISSPATDIVCSGAPYSYTITSATASTYAWSRAIVSGITNAAGSGATSSISETLTNSTNAPVDVIYLITPTSTTGTCAGNQFSLKVTVNPKPVVSSLNTETVCSNSPLAYTITSNIGSSYSWTRTAVAGVINPTVTSSANPITETLINTTSTPKDVIYLITPTSTTGTCVGNAFSLTVTVNPKPVITSALTDDVCSNSIFTYAITSNTSSSYSWKRDVVTGISNAAGSGTSSPISETLVNTTTAPVVVAYLITPTSTGGTCLGDETQVNVTVNPKPTITSLNTASVCSGNALAYVITSSEPSSYAWSRSAVAGITPTTGAGNSSPITETLTSTSSSSVDVIYLIQATSTANVCTGDAFSLTVTVNPKPTITSPLTASVCSGSPVNYEITSSSSASYSWTRAAVTGITPTTGSGNSSKITEVLVSSSSSSVDVVYSVTANSTAGCGGDVATITVTVNPKPTLTVSAGGPTTFCSGGSVVLTATPDITGGTVEWVGGGIAWGNANPITVSTEGIYTAVYTTTNSCLSDNSSSIIVSITPNTSGAFAQLDSVTTCLDNILLVGNKPLVGTGTWSIVSPIPYAPADLQTIPGRSIDSMNAVNLVNGVSYKFLYKVTSGCGADQTDTTFVKVGVDDFGLTASAPSDTLCVQTKRNLTAQVTGKGGSGDYNYVWSGSDGTSFTTKTPVITVSPTKVTTDYIVYVEDLKQTGCKTNEVPLTLNAINGQNLFVPNLITPNGDGKNEIFYLADVTTYPGIEMPLIQEGSYVIVTNRWGNTVFEANNYQNNWNPKDLTDGIYYYQITTTCGNKEYKSWLQILGNKNN